MFRVLWQSSVRLLQSHKKVSTPNASEMLRFRNAPKQISLYVSCCECAIFGHVGTSYCDFAMFVYYTCVLLDLPPHTLVSVYQVQMVKRVLLV